MRGWGWMVWLLAVVVPACTSRPNVVEAPAPVKPPAVSAPFDIDAVIHQVRHAFRPEVGGWSGGYQSYEVLVKPAGVELHAVQREDGSVLKSTTLELGRVAIQRSSGAAVTTPTDFVRLSDGSLSAEGGLGAEHLVNTEAGLEQSWTFSRAPRGRGDLIVTVPIRGLSHAGTTDTGVHFVDPESGLGFRYGHGTWIDGDGRKTSVPAQLVRGAVVLQVPEAVLTKSRYPAVLDPLISPEFGLDQPVFGVKGGSQESIAVASNGTEYFVAWRDFRSVTGGFQIIGTRVDSTGQAIDLGGIAITTNGAAGLVTEVASNGTDYFVVWEGGDPGQTHSDVFGARVSGTGVPLDLNGRRICGAPGDQRNATVASNGTDYFVAWHDLRSGNGDIYGTRVSSAGIAAVPDGVALTSSSGNEREPSVASDGTDWLVVWEGSGPSDLDVFGTRVTAAGAVMDVEGFVISAATGDQLKPAVASSGAEYFVVWEDTRSGRRIYGTRVSPAGTVLDGLGVQIGFAPFSQYAPLIAGRATGYFVAWSQFNISRFEIVGARVSVSATVQDNPAVSIRTVVGSPLGQRVAASSSGFLVVWQEAPVASQVRAARVDLSGAVLDAEGFVLGTAGNSQETPAVATNGSGYFVSWVDNRSGQWALYGVRLGPSGTVLDPSGLLLSSSASGGTDILGRSVSVASNGQDYFVAWAHPSATSRDVSGIRVTAAGVQLDASPIAISAAVGQQWVPEVSSDGTDYFVAWQDARRGAFDDVYGTRVTSTGLVRDPAGILLGEGRSPFVASNGTNWLVTWHRGPSGDSDVHGARVDAMGTVLDDAGIAVANALGPQRSHRVARTGNDSFVVWTEDRSDSTTELRGARLSAQGVVTPSAGVHLLTTANPANLTSLTPMGTGFLLTWFETSPERTYASFAVRLSSDGVVVDDPSLLIADAGSESGSRAACLGPGNCLLAAPRFELQTTNSVRVVGRVMTSDEPPRAFHADAGTREDEALPVVLRGFDPDGDTVTCAIVNPPAHGLLTGTPPHLTYTPAPDFHGLDAFTFRLQGGGDDSNLATVRIEVTPVNDAPLALNQNLTVTQGQPVAVSLAATDVDGDALTFIVVTPPSTGTLRGTPPALTWEPPAGFRGQASLVFHARDATETSNDAVVLIDVENGAPSVVIAATPTRPIEGQAVSFSSRAEDPGPDALSFAWDFGDGATSEDAAPTHAFTDQGRFTVRLTVSDGTASTTVSLDVDVENGAPTIRPSSNQVTGDEGHLLRFSVELDDPGVADPLVVHWDFGDGSLPVEGPTVEHAFADAGSYDVTITATDGDGAATIAHWQATIREVTFTPVNETSRETLPTGCACASRNEFGATWVIGLVALALSRRRQSRTSST